MCLAAKLLILQCFARWAGHQWGWIPAEILVGIQAQNNPEAVEEVERLTYQHTVPGAMGYGQVRPGHNPFDPDKLFVKIGAGLEVGFEGDTLRAGGGAACSPATSGPATTPAWRVAPRRSRAAAGRDQGERRVPGVRRPPAQRRASAGRRREGARKGPMGRMRPRAMA